MNTRALIERKRERVSSEAARARANAVNNENGSLIQMESGYT